MSPFRLLGLFYFLTSLQEVLAISRSLQIKDQPPCREPDPELTYFCPMSRYCEWDYYHPNTRQFLRTSLDYTRRRWNYMDQVNEEIELTSFDELDANQTMVLELLGFDEASHDCCHGHYTAYDWDDFDGDLSGVKAAWELLGYNQQLWDGGASTAAEDLDWDELPSEVRIALRSNLCYSKEIWDGVDISSWSDGVVLPGTFMEKGREVVFVTGSPTEAPTTASPTTFVEKPTMTPLAVASTIPTKFTSMNPSVASSSSPSAKQTQVPTDKPTSLTTAPTSDPLSNLVSEMNKQPPCRELKSDVTYFCPAQRYCEWDHFKMSITQTLQSFLGYTEGSWNYENNQINDDIELTRFDALSKTQREMLQVFGFEKDTHDCCNSHFMTFDWSELFSTKHSTVAAALILFGYTDEFKWNQRSKNERSPIYDDLSWDELPDAVRFSARAYLCYTREIWDKVDLTSWPKEAVLPGSDEEEAESSLIITTAPSVKLTNEPSSHPSKAIKKIEPTTNPTLQDSDPPSTISPSPESSSATTSGSSCRNLDPNMNYFCPTGRYCEWNFYDFNARQFLEFQIGYSQSTWNYLDTHPLELTAYEDLSKNVRDGLTIFAGFDESKHDCCLGHYSSYDWADFNDEEDENMMEVKEALILMGYNQTLWDSGSDAVYDDFDWDELPMEIQSVASKALCYSKETWDMIPLTLWPENALLPGQSMKSDNFVPTPVMPVSSKPTRSPITLIPTPTPCRVLNPDTEYFCPPIRYCEFDTFDLAMKQLLSFRIGYTEADWNYESMNEIELAAFSDLNKFVTSGLSELGFDEDKHDCCHNHYESYDWDEFISEGMDGVLTTYEMIGYNKEKWDRGEPSDLDKVNWDFLSPEIRINLSEHLCYNRELWNNVPLRRWPENVRLPGSDESINVEVTSSSLRLVPALVLTHLGLLYYFFSL